jgi:hypothetical protein
MILTYYKGGTERIKTASILAHIRFEDHHLYRRLAVFLLLMSLPNVVIVTPVPVML